MTSIEQPVPDNLPLLTQVADGDTLDDLPTLTEIIEETQHLAPSCSLSEADMQQSLKQLEAHLETVFTHKLSFHLEQLQRRAVEQAVNELKAELPELLHNALNTAINNNRQSKK